MANVEERSRLAIEIQIVLITAAVYVNGYAYEYTHASYFGYPAEFLSIGLQNLLFSGLLFLVVGLMGFVGYGTLMDLADLTKPERFPAVWVTAFCRYGVPLIFLAIIYAATGFRLSMVALPAFMMLAPYAPELVMLVGTNRDIPVSEKFGAYLEKPVPIQPWFHQSLRSGKYRDFRVYAIIFTAIVFVSVLISIAEATWKSSLPSTPEMDQVILRRYGDYYVVAGFDVKTRTIRSEFRLVPIADFKQSLKYLDAGPFKLDRPTK